MTKLQLEVGKTYNTRGGSRSIIKGRQNNGTYPFYGFRDGIERSYSPDGRWNLLGRDFDDDLISEYIEPTPIIPVLTPRPHAALRIDHANGYDIQRFNSDGLWIDTATPQWLALGLYRRKPEPAPLKPNNVKFIAIYPNNFSRWFYDKEEQMPNAVYTTIRIEFNPNNQTLVSAEVVTL